MELIPASSVSRVDSHFPGCCTDVRETDRVKYIQSLMDRMPEFQETGWLPDGNDTDVWYTGHFYGCLFWIFIV